MAALRASGGSMSIVRSDQAGTVTTTCSQRSARRARRPDDVHLGVTASVRIRAHVGDVAMQPSGSRAAQRVEWPLVPADHMGVDLTEAGPACRGTAHLGQPVERVDGVPLDPGLGLDDDADPRRDPWVADHGRDEGAEVDVPQGGERGRRRDHGRRRGVELLHDRTRHTVERKQRATFMGVEHPAQVLVTAAGTLVRAQLTLDDDAGVSVVEDNRQSELTKHGEHGVARPELLHPRLGGHPIRERDRADPSADVWRGLDDGAVDAAPGQRLGAHQPGEAGADDDDVWATARAAHGEHRRHGTSTFRNCRSSVDDGPANTTGPVASCVERQLRRYRIALTATSR